MQLRGKHVVAAACAYEAAAIWSGKVPTITRLQARHKIVGAVVVAWLIVHFMRQEREPWECCSDPFDDDLSYYRPRRLS